MSADDEWLPADVKMADYWVTAIGGSYTPAKLGKHESSHPLTVKRVLDQVRGTETADVIVGLVFALSCALLREEMAWERVHELETVGPDTSDNQTRRGPIMDWRRIEALVVEHFRQIGWKPVVQVEEFMRGDWTVKHAMRQINLSDLARDLAFQIESENAAQWRSNCRTDRMPATKREQG